jgi:hypothetical protein
MQYLIGLALIIGILYLIWLFITKILIPVMGVIAVFSAIVGAVGALIFSIVNYIRSVVTNINPYRTYVDTFRNRVEGIRRNYFFGPGYHQIGNIIKGAFNNNFKTIDYLKNWVTGLSLPWYLIIWPWIFFIIFCVVIGVAGSLWTLLLSAIHIPVVFSFMCFFYILFSLLWLIDRIVLAAHSIVSRCPQCKGHSVIPVFECPACGMRHKRLVPGPYGILTRTCSCGNNLPCTFLNGRSKLDSYCPHCESELASSSSSQFGLQLVGGASVGKTVFLASFLHLYRQKLASLRVGFKIHPQAAFDDLEYWFGRGKSEATHEMNAKMYSIVHKKTDSDVSHQLALYDVAGEVFENQSADMEQRQYGYCGGIILMIDPFSVQSVRSAYAASHKGKGPENYSKSDIDEVITGFIDEFSKMKFIKTGMISDIPLAVVITKADTDVVNREIGFARLAEAFKKNPGIYNNNPNTARDIICLNYLKTLGMSGAVNNLAAQFRTIHYFPVSAMGHEASGAAYQPWGVLESVMWIIKEYDPILAEMLRIK